VGLSASWASSPAFTSKGPTEVNFKHGGGQKFFAGSTHKLIPISHFQNDCATSRPTSVDPVSNSMLLKLKRGESKESSKGTEADVH